MTAKSLAIPRPVADLVRGGLQAVAAQVIDVRSQAMQGQHLRIGCRQPQELGIDGGLHGQFVDRIALDLVLVEMRGCDVVQIPAARVGCRKIDSGGALDGPQARGPVQLEHGHAAEGPVHLAGLHAQYAVAVLDPGAAGAGETDIVQFTDGLFALGELRHGGRRVLADAEHDDGESHAREAHGPCDAPHGDARCPRHHQFAARGEIAETHERTDHGADRQQFEGLLRHIQQGEQKRVSRAVAADADIALLADEGHQRAQGEQHAHDHQRVQQHGAVQVSIENVHAFLASRMTRYKPSASAAACTHHTPICGGSSLFSTQILAADNRLE